MPLGKTLISTKHRYIYSFGILAPSFPISARAIMIIDKRLSDPRRLHQAVETGKLRLSTRYATSSAMALAYHISLTMQNHSVMAGMTAPTTCAMHFLNERWKIDPFGKRGWIRR